MKFLLHLFLFLMRLGQLANCFNDNVVSRDNQAVPQVQNNSIATVTVLLYIYILSATLQNCIWIGASICTLPMQASTKCRMRMS